MIRPVFGEEKDGLSFIKCLKMSSSQNIAETNQVDFFVFILKTFLLSFD